MTIEPCSKEKALEILQDPSVVRLTKVEFEDLPSTDFLFLVNGVILLFLRAVSSVVEIHVAVPYRARAGAKQVFKEIIEFIKSGGAEEVWTDAPDDRQGLKRMLANLNFIPENGRWVIRWQ